MLLTWLCFLKTCALSCFWSGKLALHWVHRSFFAPSKYIIEKNLWSWYDDNTVSQNMFLEIVTLKKSPPTNLQRKESDKNPCPKFYLRCTGRVWYPGVTSCVCSEEILWKMISRTYCKRGLLVSVWQLLCYHKDRLVEIFLLPRQDSEILF